MNLWLLPKQRMLEGSYNIFRAKILHDGIWDEWSPLPPPRVGSEFSDFLELCWGHVPEISKSWTEPNFSSYSPTATLIMNLNIYKVGLEAHIQHWTFSHVQSNDASMVEGC